jgi:hypothetical protein
MLFQKNDVVTIVCVLFIYVKSKSLLRRYAGNKFLRSVEFAKVDELSSQKVVE